MGFVSAEAVEEALSVQEKRRSEGLNVPLLGQILVELNHLTPEQLQQLIEVIYPVADDAGNDPDTPSESGEED